jgi:tryptophan synthase alpha chain
MNMSQVDRIGLTFKQLKSSGRAALIPYISAGNPRANSTVTIMHALVKAGADIIELGVPFSDPMADGPVIQKAAEHAISQGVGLSKVLEMVAEFRQQDQTTPVVLMGYANPIERMGQTEFVERAAQVGVDGVLVVDYPPEEVEVFSALLQAHGMALIFLLAPTSTDARIASVAKVARGYVYYVSLNGITGAGHLDTDQVAAKLDRIRQHVTIPLGVGFGIRDVQSAQRIATMADAVVIGTKLIEIMNQAAHGLPVDQQTNAAALAGGQWLSTIHEGLVQIAEQSEADQAL